MWQARMVQGWVLWLVLWALISPAHARLHLPEWLHSIVLVSTITDHQHEPPRHAHYDAPYDCQWCQQYELLQQGLVGTYLLVYQTLCGVVWPVSAVVLAPGPRDVLYPIRAPPTFLKQTAGFQA
ncbi:MAG: hypothetical protein R3Y10_03565 [Ferrimonas sp.]